MVEPPPSRRISARTDPHPSRRISARIPHSRRISARISLPAPSRRISAKIPPLLPPVEESQLGYRQEAKHRLHRLIFLSTEQEGWRNNPTSDRNVPCSGGRRPELCPCQASPLLSHLHQGIMVHITVTRHVDKRSLIYSEKDTLPSGFSSPHVLWL